MVQDEAGQGLVVAFGTAARSCPPAHRMDPGLHQQLVGSRATPGARFVVLVGDLAPISSTNLLGDDARSAAVLV